MDDNIEDYFADLPPDLNQGSADDDLANDQTFGDVSDIIAGADASEAMWKNSHEAYAYSIEQERSRMNGTQEKSPPLSQLQPKDQILLGKWTQNSVLPQPPPMPNIPQNQTQYYANTNQVQGYPVPQGFGYSSSSKNEIQQPQQSNLQSMAQFSSHPYPPRGYSYSGAIQQQQLIQLHQHQHQHQQQQQQRQNLQPYQFLDSSQPLRLQDIEGSLPIIKSDPLQQHQQTQQTKQQQQQQQQQLQQQQQQGKQENDLPQSQNDQQTWQQREQMKSYSQNRDQLYRNPRQDDAQNPEGSWNIGNMTEFPPLGSEPPSSSSKKVHNSNINNYENNSNMHHNRNQAGKFQRYNNDFNNRNNQNQGYQDRRYNNKNYDNYNNTNNNRNYNRQNPRKGPRPRMILSMTSWEIQNVLRMHIRQLEQQLSAYPSQAANTANSSATTQIYDNDATDSTEHPEPSETSSFNHDYYLDLYREKHVHTDAVAFLPENLDQPIPDDPKYLERLQNQANEAKNSENNTTDYEKVAKDNSSATEAEKLENVHKTPAETSSLPQNSEKVKESPSLDQNLSEAERRRKENLQQLANSLGTFHSWNAKGPRRALEISGSRSSTASLATATGLIKKRGEELKKEIGLLRENERVAIRVVVEQGYDVICDIDDYKQRTKKNKVENNPVTIDASIHAQTISTPDYLALKLYEVMTKPDPALLAGTAVEPDAFLLRMCFMAKGKRFIVKSMNYLNSKHQLSILNVVIKNLGSLGNRALFSPEEWKDMVPFWNSVSSKIMDVEELDDVTQLVNSFLEENQEADLFLGTLASEPGLRVICSLLSHAFSLICGGPGEGSDRALGSSSWTKIFKIFSSKVIPVLLYLFDLAPNANRVWELSAFLDALMDDSDRENLRALLNQALEAGVQPPTRI